MLQTFNHYFITEHIARKSAWDIYRSYPVQEPGHTVILKIFDAECLNPSATAEHVLRMQTRLQQLSHPALVPVLDLGIEQGQPYSVTEYLAGTSLRVYLQQRSSQRLTLDEAFRILTCIGQAITYAHTQHLSHLNINPENIFLTEKGEVFLTDFRLQDLIDEKKLGQKLDDRMVSYLAPEQLIGLLPERLTQNMTSEQRAASVSPQSDQYALGCLLYELLTGTLPCTVNDLQFLWQYIPLTPSAIVPSLSHSIDTVILRALSKRSAERYADVAAFLAALSSAVHPEPPAFPFAHLNRAQAPVVPTSKAEEALHDIFFPRQQSSLEAIEPMVHSELSQEVTETERSERDISPINHSVDLSQAATSFDEDNFLLGLPEDTYYSYDEESDLQEEIAPTLLTTQNEPDFQDEISTTLLAAPDEPALFEEEPFGFTPASVESVKDSSGMLSSVSISSDEHPQIQSLSPMQDDDFLTLSSAIQLEQSSSAVASSSSIANDAISPVFPSLSLAKTTLDKLSSASSNHASKVDVKPVFVPQPRSVKHRSRSLILLMIALLCSIIATLLASALNPATIIALQQTSTTSTTLAHLNPTATPGTTLWSSTLMTPTPKPTATPQPTPTPKPTATPKPTPTPLPTVSVIHNPPPAPTPTPTPGPTATTTNVALNATVTASSDFPSDGWTLAAVHDGERAQTSTAPGWSSNGNPNANHSETLQFDFGSKQYINEMDVYICTNNGANGYGMPVDFTIDVSNDAQTWTTVVTRTNYPAPTTTALQSFSFNLQNVRYIRIDGTSLRQSSGDNDLYRMQFAEVEVY